MTVFSTLSIDLLHLISKYLQEKEDYISFLLVCKSWSKVADMVNANMTYSRVIIVDGKKPMLHTWKSSSSCDIHEGLLPKGISIYFFIDMGLYHMYLKRDNNHNHYEGYASLEERVINYWTFEGWKKGPPFIYIDTVHESVTIDGKIEYFY